MRRFAEDCLEFYENRAYNLSNNLMLHEISILNVFQFYCKISRNQLEMVEEALMTYKYINTLKC